MSDVELEPEWVREKAAKQESARNPPPRKSKAVWLVPVVGILVAAGLIAVVIYAGDDSHSSSQSASGETVYFEIRAVPTAEIRMNGKKVGTTPISLQLPKGTKQVTIEATMHRKLVKLGKTSGAKDEVFKGTKDEVYKGTRVLTPDRDRTVDFSLSSANLVESTTSEDEAK
jgi:hypothetical protein